MPSKIRRDDWDRYFSPKGPRHGGPLSVLFSTLIVLGTVAALGFGLVKGKDYLDKDLASRRATATSIAATMGPEDTATAIAAAKTATARRAPSPTPEVPIIVGTVVNGGNLRSEPRVAPETIIGQIAAGAEFLFLEERTVEDQTWYRIRITKQGADDGSENPVDVGTEGWASTILLSELSEPLPPTPDPAATPDPADDLTPTPPPPSPTPVGPLGVLRPVVSLELGLSIQVPESWSEVKDLAGSKYGWGSTTSDQQGMLFGTLSEVVDRSPGAVSLISDTCVMSLISDLSVGGSLPTTRTEATNPDGTIQGSVSLVGMQGRTRSYLKKEQLLCLVFLVPEDEFTAKSSAMQQVLNQAIIQ